ncbi:MAG: phosphoenolpyruvate--protein phosphotransferase [Mesorhizobium sp.]|nr:phosphoenolpyruvate--protein phosphotransferase [Mesorhizobium sp.]MCO5161685.1 phosphoenolpyruvate--protein phosphotransferase [Mesorhizobium sp.]
MNDRPPIVLTGIAASPGFAAGPLCRLDTTTASYAPKATKAEEIEALVEAISTASAAVAELIEGSSGESADILEFQLAMLADDSLAEPALAAIGQGADAASAWTRALNIEIGGYEAASDDYFRARAADMKDIRDRVLRVLTGAHGDAVPAGAILVGEDIAPTRFLETDWSAGGGIALARGSSASHVAMLARSRGVPMVVGLGDALLALSGEALLDARDGTLTAFASTADVARYRAAAADFAAARSSAAAYLMEPAMTADGTRVQAYVNVADPSDVDAIDVTACDGVGLMRSEFLFSRGLPDEESQYRAYARVLEWAQGKPVTIRTVDAGGDKPIAGFTVAEGNPFLGLRGIRLSLARAEIFRVQIRALLRAAVHGNLKVMFPMIAVASEYSKAKRLFEKEAQALSALGTAHRMPPLGIMVEVPSVAIAPDVFADVAFFSIGSNDLTQYVMAAARDNASVATLNDTSHPAVLRLIGEVTAFGAARGIPVSLCGDAGGDPALIPHLLKAGLRELSASPAQLAAAKAAIAGVKL